MSAAEELSREDYEALLDDELLTASDAREDLATFCEYVVRDEKTHRPVRLAPHQRVLIEFLTAHDRGAIMLPVGHGKSWVLLAYTLWSMGRNPSMRGAIVSAAQQQAEKYVTTIKDYVENSPELHLVFPGLRRSSRASDHWTQSAICVERPLGGVHATLIAVGVDTKTILGSRLDWVVIDDILNMENTGTKDACLKVREWVNTTVHGRMDTEQVGEAKFFVSNTPWHTDDLVMACKRDGWATLHMDADGFVTVQDDVEVMRVAAELGEPYAPFDSEHLRPAVVTDDEKHPLYNACRLAAHGDDTPLWPERVGRKELDKIRRTIGLHAYLRSYMCQCRDNDTAWCKEEWIEFGKQLSREPDNELKAHMPGGRSFADYSEKNRGALLYLKYDGTYQAFTGLDLAFSEKAKSDDVAFFTFVPLPTGHRLVLDVEIGKWNSPTIARKIRDKHLKFRSIVIVEDNAAQKAVIDLMKGVAKGIPIKGFTTTGAKKASVENGLPVIFSELEQGLWVIPSDRFGQVHPHVQQWADGLLSYSPSAHTPDALMAQFFARDRARIFGLLTPQAPGEGGDGALAGINDR